MHILVDRGTPIYRGVAELKHSQTYGGLTVIPLHMWLDKCFINQQYVLEKRIEPAWWVRR